MAQFTHRIDLTKSNFPLLSSEMGRTVLVSNSRSTPTNEASNPPEVLYMHNVMPTVRGLQSVGFSELVAAPIGVDAVNNLAGLITVSFSHNSLGSYTASVKMHIAYRVTAGLAFYVARTTDATWTKDSGTLTSNIEPTVANVNGVSYVLTDFDTVSTVEHTNKKLVAVAFIGSTFTVVGITEAFGYLIAWESNGTTVAWSSLINPLDLTPSAATGSGNGKVEKLKGKIIICAANSTGFIIYSQYNAVAAVYTGNKQFPFKFIAIENSRGLSDPADALGSLYPSRFLLAEDSDSYSHFVYTAGAGLQLINTKEAKNILPAVSDFLSGKVIEDFDETTKTFSITNVATDETLNKRLSFIGGRYLIVSYGITELTHALIYDILLEKVGKIKYTHISAIEQTRDISVVGNQGREYPNSNIALMDKTGLVKVVTLNSIDVTRSGVLILGKYQWHRDRFLTLQRVTAENVESTDSFSFTDLASLDGRNISSQVIGVETVGVGYREFALRSSAKNHSLAFIGSFILNSLELLFTLGGRR